MPDKFRRLIAADKLERVIEELINFISEEDDDLTNKLIMHRATLTKNKEESRRGLITSSQEGVTRTRVGYALLEMLGEIVDPAEPTVFISYNHGDSEIAYKLKRTLEQNGIEVRIDQAVMEAGANIQRFIERSIRDTDITLSIVSNRSLLSAWVGLESINTFYHERFESEKKFIACYIDDDFFQTDFRINATKKIDSKIEEIDNLILEYIRERMDTNDLNNERSRLIQLRNNLGDILLRLKDSLCLDIREDKFEESVTKIISTIT